MAAFAALQLNDPDALTWVLLYGVAALPWLGVLLERRWHLANFAALVLLVFAMGTYWPSLLELLGEGSITDLASEMSPHRPYIEQAREFLGLALAAIPLLLLVARRVRALTAESRKG